MTFAKLAFAHRVLRKLAGGDLEKKALLGTALNVAGGVMSGKQVLDSAKSIPGQIKGYQTGFKWAANPASREPIG